MLAFALQTAAAFNLVCTGTRTIEPSYPPFSPATAEAPFAITYRVDLDRALYCTDDCASVEPIDDVREGLIVFRNTSILSGTEDGIVIGVDRRTGRYIASAVGVETVRHVGLCERAPFTGFPPSASSPASAAPLSMPGRGQSQ